MLRLLERAVGAWERLARASEIMNGLQAQVIELQMSQAQTAQKLEEVLMTTFADGGSAEVGEYVWVPEEDEDDDSGTRH